MQIQLQKQNSVSQKYSIIENDRMNSMDSKGYDKSNSQYNDSLKTNNNHKQHVQKNRSSNKKQKQK